MSTQRTVPRARRAVPGLLTATAASVTANAMVAVLVPWLVLTRTGSAAQAGLVGSVALAAAVPALVAGGPLIDRWGRRRVSAGADLLSALAVAALPLLDVTVGLTLAATLALVAVGAVFDGPGAAAREAARPEVAVAGRVPLPTVNARGEAAEQVGEIAGPALAGVGIAAVGALASLGVAAALLAGAALTTWLTMPPDGARPATAEPYRAAALAGLRVVWGDRTLRAVTLLAAVVMVFFAPLTLILTVHLAGDPGVLAGVAAAVGVGAIAGALGHARIAARVRPRTVLLTGLAGAAVGLAALSLLPGPALLTVAALLTGVALGPVNPVLATVLQSRAPADLRGRVVSTQWSLALVASPLGVLGAGLLLEAVGPGPALLAVAVGVLATGALAAASPALRDIDGGRPDPRRPDPEEDP